MIDSARCSSCQGEASERHIGQPCPHCGIDRLVSGYEYEARKISALARHDPAALWLRSNSTVSTNPLQGRSRHRAPRTCDQSLAAFKRAAGQVVFLTTESSVGFVLMRGDVARDVGIRDGQVIRYDGVCWTVELDDCLPACTDDGAEIAGLFVHDAEMLEPRVIYRDQLGKLRRRD